MVPSDVPWIEEGPIPHNQTILQYMKPPTGLHSVPPRDIQADWSGDKGPSPPNILLDFMYGATVVKHWKCGHLGNMLEKWFEHDFGRVLAENPKCASPKDDKSKVKPDDLEDPNWIPWKGK